ncbi:MAG: S-layer homology domain-containing protein [Chloroflexi bacterium]|nr:S-layer homology domain-containing protein [Chloroflexota bacterium]
MRKLRKYLNLFFIFCLTVGLVGLPTVAVHAQSGSALTSPDGMLNPDGTLKVDGAFNGALDLKGWDVAIDPQKGPVFSQANSPALGNWENLGEGGSALNYYVSSIVLIGTDVYVGGGFTNADSIAEADYVAMWDGTTWHALGSNGAGNGSLNSSVYSLYFDGNYLYAGGAFIDVNNNGTVLGSADYIARWDGGDWSSLSSNGAGNGSLSSDVRAIVDDGQYLYVGGRFANVNNNGTLLNEADYIARWDGTNWASLGNNGAGVGALNNYVYAVAMDGTDLYAGGTFTNAGGNTAADYIAKWNGSSWNALGDNGAGDGAIDQAGSAVYALAVDTAGNLYVGGNLSNVNNGATNMPDAAGLVKWNGSAWSAIGTDGIHPSITGAVEAITIDLSNQNVYVGGYFNNVNNSGTVLPTADRIAKWDGSNWSGFGSNGAGDGALINPVGGSSAVFAIRAFNGTVYAGGFFEDVSDEGSTLPLSSHFVEWKAGHWSEVGSTPNGSIGNMPAPTVNTLAVIGTDVYVGGSFTDLDDQGINLSAADNIAKWDGSHWSALGNGLNSTVQTMFVDGTDLYVGGTFQNAGGNGAADFLAKWNGTTWSAIGNDGAGGGSLNNTVYAITKIGTNLYVGGTFTNVKDTDSSTLNDADYIATWDGSHWHALTTGAGGPLNNSVTALEALGTDLYVGGNFTDANGIPEADYLARWDGAAWSALGNSGAGVGALNNSVLALEVLGTDLYAGGSFTDAGGVPQADYVARFNGAGWSALGSNQAGTDGSLLSQVRALAGAGNTLFVGGDFTGVSDSSGLLPAADFIAKWDGSHWSALGNDGAGNGSLNKPVHALALGSVVYAGGPFHDVNNNGTVLKTADYVAAYGADVTAPSVISNLRASTNPTNAASVEFMVTFSETVTNVDTADFTLTKTGSISGESIANVSGSGSTRTVTVNTGMGAGTLRLDIPNGATISDGNNNLVGLPYTSGQVYSVRTQTFNDVPINYWSWQFVERLYSAGVTGGCSNSPMLYCPGTTVTRDQMAVFLLRGEHGSSYTPPAATGSMFADVPQNYWAAAWIEQLATEGITGGCGNGNYCPSLPVTRDQMAVFLLRGEHGGGYVPPTATGTMFGDVSQNYWAAAWIEQLANEGITGGCGNGDYCPSTPVTRDQMAVFLVRTFSLP